MQGYINLTSCLYTQDVLNEGFLMDQIRVSFLMTQT